MGVEFDEIKPQNYGYTPQKSGLTGLFIKWGLGKDEKSAQVFMVIFSVICLGLAFVIGF